MRQFIFQLRTALLFLFILPSASWAGNLFKITSSGSLLPQAISFTLCLNAKGDKPLNCQTYTTQYSVISIQTTIPNRTYPYVGIKINTPGHVYSTPPGGNGYSLIGTISDTQAAAGQIASSNGFTVTPSGINVSLSPNTPQTVKLGSTQAFTITANDLYMMSNTVGGSCPAGSWSGHTYTTGAITSACTVIFGASLGTLYIGTSYGDVITTLNDGVTWSTTNQPGGAPLQQGLFILNDTMYLGGYNGNVEIGTMGGTHWTHTAAQPDGTAVLAVVAASAQHLYVGTTSGNVAISYDGGASWSLTNPAQENGEMGAYIGKIISIAIDDSTPRNIYVISQYSTTERIYHATETGTHLSAWDNTITPSIPTDCYNGSSVYAGSVSVHSGSLYVSSINSGYLCRGSSMVGGIPSAWTSYSGSGPSSPTPYSGTSSLSIIPSMLASAAPSTLPFPTLVGGSGGSYIYKSTGLSGSAIEWEFACDMPSVDYSTTIGSSFVSAGHVYFTTLVGYLAQCSLTGSTTPTVIAQPGGSRIYGLSVQADGTLYVGGSSTAMQRSTDHGNTWQHQPDSMLSAFAERNILTMSVVPNGSDTDILAVSSSYLYGNSKLYAYQSSLWNPVPDVTVNAPLSYQALFYDKNSGMTYISQITSDSAPSVHNEVYRVSDVWSSPVLTSLGSPNGYPVYGLYYAGGLIYASTTNGHIYTSSGDLTWTALPSDPESGVAVNSLLVFNAQIIYAGMASGSVKVTHDGGHTWASLPNTASAPVLSLQLLPL